MKSKINILIAVLTLALVSCLENDIVIDTDNLDFRIYEITGPVTTLHAPLYKSIEKWMDFEGLTVIDGVICITYVKSAKINWKENEIGINEFNSSPEWEFYVPDVSSGEWFLDGGQLKYAGEMTDKVKITTGEDDGSYVTYAELASCRLTFSFDIPSNLMGNVTITIPELTKNGVPFKETYSNLTGVKEFSPENLEDYIMKIPDKELQLKCDFEVRSLIGLSGGRLSVGLSISDVRVDYMKGYFGQLDYIPEEADKQIAFDFFEELEFDGTIGIRDIVFETTVSSSIGVPLNIVTKEISFINEDGLKKKLANPFTLEILSAIESDESNHTIIPQNDSNSQTLSDILFDKEEKYPTGILFDFSGTLNPNGDNPAGKNFILRSSSDLAEAEVKITVPLYFNVESYNRKDTVNFDYNDLIKDDEEFSKSVEKCVITLKVNNQLPFEVILSVYAIDEAKNVVGEYIVTDMELVAKPDKQSPITIELTNDQLVLFSEKNVKSIVFNTRAGTNGYQKVYEEDYIDIDVSINVKSSIPSNIF